MSTFNVDNEIDTLVDKLGTQFKVRIKKLITRSEKLVLKQYIASQKETMRVTRGTRVSRTQQSKTQDKSKKGKSKAVRARKVHHREKEYKYNDDEFVYSDDSE